MKKIIASGPVIIENGKLLVSKDKKDNFYKIPGGTLEKSESLEECAKRELKEETGFKCNLIKKLSTMFLEKKPETNEKVKIELHHYSAKLEKSPENYNAFNYKNHKILWISIEEIKQNKYKIAPNIKFLLEKKEIK